MRKNLLAKWAARGAAAAAGAAVAVAVGVGIADASSHTLQTAANSTLGKTIVVNGKGVTVYALSPETTRHLLCKPGACFSFWPPLTVPSARTKLTKTAGVPGKLGILKRGKLFQVTLAGHPLYRFSPDGNKAGAAGGNGIQNFGGTWHVVAASAAAAKTTATTTSTPTYPSVY